MSNQRRTIIVGNVGEHQWERRNRLGETIILDGSAGAFIEKIEHETFAIVCDNGLYRPYTEQPTVDEIGTMTQRHKVVRPLQWCWAILYCLPSFSYSTPELGKIYGRDHTTVISGLYRVAGVIKNAKRTAERALFLEYAKGLGVELATKIINGRFCINKNYQNV